MSEKTQLEILCTEKIPRLLGGESPGKVFEENTQKQIRPCNTTCPEYRLRTESQNCCEQDLLPVSSGYVKCRFGYPFAQSPPKCIEPPIRSDAIAEVALEFLAEQRGKDPEFYK